MNNIVRTDLDGITARAWNELAVEGILDTPFARHEYLAQWWNTRGGAEWPDASQAVYAARRDGELKGIAPFIVAEHAGRPSVLLLGSIEVSDYLDLIVRAADVEWFAAATLDALQKDDQLRGLPLDLYNIPEASPTLPVLRAEARRRGWTYREEPYRPTPHIELNGSFESYLSRLEKKQRHEVRRKLRRAAEGPTPAAFEVVHEAAQLDEATWDFLDLMEHDDEKRRFMVPAMREHMRGVIHTAWAGGYLWLTFLTVGSVRAAASLGFDYRNRLWGYNSAVNSNFMQLSPGWVLLTLQLQWACEHGREEFDFMRGGEEYKYRFGAVDRRVMRAVLNPA